MRLLAPRWRKVVRDVWSNKTRTILVLLSIAVGVSALGMVMGSQQIVDESLPEAYAAVNPAHAQMFTLDTFDDDMVEAIRSMDEIAAAEGRRTVNVRFLTQEGEWRSLQLTALPDYEDITLNKLYPEEGEYPPEQDTVLIERASLSPVQGLDGFEFGDTLTVEAPNGRQRQLKFTGTVHDMSQLPAFLTGSGYGYINYETLVRLGEPRD